MRIPIIDANHPIETTTGDALQKADRSVDHTPPPIGRSCSADPGQPRAAREPGIPRFTSDELAKLAGGVRSSIAVVGTHGRTVTAALLAFLLYREGRTPGFALTSRPLDLPRRSMPGGEKSPIICEGSANELSSILGGKPQVVLVTATEGDPHSTASTTERDALKKLIASIPANGCLVAPTADEALLEVISHARCKVIYYGLQKDLDRTTPPTWCAALAEPSSSTQAFDLFAGGTFCGRMTSALLGKEGVLCALGAIIVAADLFAVRMQSLSSNLAEFQGVEGHEQCIGIAAGTYIYDCWTETTWEMRQAIHSARIRLGDEPGRLCVCFELENAAEELDPKLSDVLAEADLAWFFHCLEPPSPVAPERSDGCLSAAAIAQKRELGSTCSAPVTSHTELLNSVTQTVRAGDHILFFSRRDRRTALPETTPTEAIENELLAELTLRSR